MTKPNDERAERAEAPEDPMARLRRANAELPRREAVHRAEQTGAVADAARARLTYLESEYASLGSAMSPLTRMEMADLRARFPAPPAESVVLPAVTAIKEIAAIEEVMATLKAGSAAWADAAGALSAARAKLAQATGGGDA